MNEDGTSEATIGNTIMFWFNELTEHSSMSSMLQNKSAQAYFQHDKNHLDDVNIPNFKVDWLECSNETIVFAQCNHR